MVQYREEFIAVQCKSGQCGADEILGHLPTSIIANDRVYEDCVNEDFINEDHVGVTSRGHVSVCGHLRAFHSWLLIDSCQ